jgi:hypothetical protein
MITVVSDTNRFASHDRRDIELGQRYELYGAAALAQRASPPINKSYKFVLKLLLLNLMF